MPYGADYRQARHGTLLFRSNFRRTIQLSPWTAQGGLALRLSVHVPLSRFATANYRWLLCLAMNVCLLAASTVAQRTATVAPASLDKLVETADTILRGSVVSTVVEPHPEFPNLQTVVVTITVYEVLKGQSGKTFTFRQLDLNARDLPGGGYGKSQELLLLLNPVSPYGLTSPAGLEQGRFRVLRDGKGNRIAVNGRNNVGLFTEVANKARSHGVALSARAKAMLAKPSAQASLDDLEDAIRSLAGTRQ
jgi:hypothetical protein